MIEATVRYRKDYVGTNIGVMHAFSDRVESTIGSALAEQMDNIDVTMLPYGTADEYGKYASGIDEQDIFIKIDVDAHHLSHLDLGLRGPVLADALYEDIKQIFGAQAPRPRVWVRPIEGSFYSG